MSLNKYESQIYNMFCYLAKVQLHSITNKKLQHELELSEQNPRVLSIACHPINNSFVLACSETGKSVRSPVDSISLSLHNSIKSSISVIDQYRLGTLTIWDWKTLKMTSRIEVQPRPFSITTTSFNHNGNLLLTGGVDGMVRLYDLANQGCIMGWHAHAGEVSYYDMQVLTVDYRSEPLWFKLKTTFLNPKLH